MMKHLLTIVFFFSVAFFARTQSIYFQKVYGDVLSDWGVSVKQSSNGEYIIAGYSNSFSQGTDDFYILKTDSNGDTLWTKIYGTINEDRSSDIELTTDGGYVVVGFSDNISTNTNIVLFKIQSNGNLQWYKTLVDVNNENSSSIRQTADDGFIISGWIVYDTPSPSPVKAYLIKSDSSGDTLWTRTYGTTGEGFNSVCNTIDGGYIATGFSCDSAQCDVYLVKTDSNGGLLWSKTYGGTKDDKGNSVCATLDGGFIIAGSTQSFGSAWINAYLLKTNSNGDTLWTKTISRMNSGGSNGLSVVETNDGGYAFSGIHGDLAGQNNMYLVKTNSNGDTLWTRTFGGGGYEDGRSLQQTVDGGYIIVGITDSYGPLYSNIYLVKTDSLGNSIDYDNGIFNYEEAKTEIKIYPNPFSTQANLILPPEVDVSDKPLLRVYDLYGNETARVTITSHRALITRDNLARGLYFCEVISNHTVIATGKFIIQ